jgi:excinuclease UvrABC nuclease subunit
MAIAAENLEYERAARLRDRVTAVRKVAEKQQMVTESAEDLDCFGMVEDELEAAIQVFYVRRGRVVGRKGLIVDKVEDLSRPQLLADVLEQHYAETPNGVPPLILVPEAPDDEETLSKWLAAQRTAETRDTGPADLPEADLEDRDMPEELLTGPGMADPVAGVGDLDVPEPAPEVLARVLAGHRPHRSAVGDVEWWAATDRYRVERSVNPAARRGAHVEIRVPQRGEKKALLETVTRNAGEEFTRHRLKRAADHNARARALNALQDALDLPESPLRIECYDMSHLQGTDYVGSMVVMEDGMPRPSEYRRFKIKTIDQNDDYGAMGEVLTRRLNAYLVERDKPVGDRHRRFAYPPQLLLVDGGKGQLGVAEQVLEELGLDEEIPLAALAKQFEEVFVPGRPDPVRIPRSSEALYLLQQIRDEAHRFAITYHRQLRGKRMTSSVLDGVPGLGPARKKRLTKELGGVSGVRAATLETLKELPWLPDSVAMAVHQKLHDPAVR